MAVTAGALEDLRGTIEALGSDPDLDPDSRVILLTDLRSNVTDLAGLIDAYVGGARKLAAAGPAAVEAAVAEARRNADWRDQVVARALATPEELDAYGLVSHDELDRLAEEGLLQEAALMLVGAADEALDVGESYAEDRHPRDRLGRWRKKLGIKVTPKQGGPLHLTGEAMAHALHEEWARADRELLPYAGMPDHPAARAIITRQKEITRRLHHLNLDRGGPEGVGKPGGPRDVVIVGSGPAGLSAAIYGATEGLDTLLVDSHDRPGGQAAMSSRIENVLGFPSGVTGEQYATKGLEQAQRVGADTTFGVRATGIDYDPKTNLKTVHLSSGEDVQARTVVLAGGVEFRRLPFPGSDAEGVIYGDSRALKEACKGQPAVVIGGANSAGQAAIDAAGALPHVTMLVRRHLRDTMSDYLVEQLESDPKVTILEGAEIASAHAGPGGHVDSVTLKDGRVIPSAGVGLFIGSAPSMDWTGVAHDEHGYLRVGEGGHEALETSTPGVYAAGDVRANSVHRVIMAAADGAHAIALAHGFVPRVSALSESADADADDEADVWLDLVDNLDHLNPYTGFDDFEPPEVEPGISTEETK